MITEKRKEAFFKYVMKNSEPCWIWTASRNKCGYGNFNVESGKGKEFKSVLAHRVAWEIFFGEIPHGLCVLHECDNPPCVNPRHLRLGTHLENMIDAAKKGRKGRSPLVVKKIRKLLGTMTQRKIAATLGVTAQHVSDVATGKTWSRYVS